MKRGAIIIFMVVLSAMIIYVEGNHTCFIALKSNSTNGNHQRWALPLNEERRCKCTKILAKALEYGPAMQDSTCEISNDPEKYWYTDQPGVLFDRSVWNTEKLKYLMDCPYTDVDGCNANMCLNGAVCLDELFAYTCMCAEGYQGSNCEIDIDECSSNPCENGGQCVDGINGYTCDCLNGYRGFQCKIDIDECSSNPCLNGGQCVDSLNGYYCNCPIEYQGDHCETAICFPECENGRICTSPNVCNCPTCYTGDTCTNVESGTPSDLGLGIDSGSIINDNQITASSYYDSGRSERLAPFKGRLHNTGYWAPIPGLVDSWIQVDFLTPIVITGIRTQGASERYFQFVKTLQVQVALDAGVFQPVVNSAGDIETFMANVDAVSVKDIHFDDHYIARFLRIYPKSWNKVVSLRLEVVGFRCSNA